MPFIESEGTSIHYRFDGSETAPTVVLSNSLGTNLCVWDGQVPALAARFRVLRYDTRGHGQSSVTPGPYSITQLGRDVVHLLNELEIDRAHFCGLSMGGMAGMWLGVYAAPRIERLALCNTAAKIGTAEIWNARIEAVRQGGMAAIVDSVIQRWFTPGFIAQAPETIERTRRMILATPPEGYMANCGAIRDMDQRETILRISAPTLVIAGLNDPVTTLSDAQYIVERVANAQYAELDAAHLSNIEAAERFTQVLLQFLASAP
jgi:3-oxoadipate enol-lactonase